MATPLTSDERGRFLSLVDQRFGIRGSEYGAARLDGAVADVLPGSGCDSPLELLDTVEADRDPRWLCELVEHLTVGETYFLRDAAQVRAIHDTILPDVATRRWSERRLRVWSAGCSTGEEIYSMAILVSDSGLFRDWDVMLLGTDVNRESLRRAREARYSDWSFRATPELTRRRYFEPTIGGWRLIEPIRRMARFAWLNLGAETLLPAATDCDVILCRNVTIYFDESATQRLYAALIHALAPGGWLVLGPSDPLPADRRGLERVDVPGAVLWRRASTPAKVDRPRTPIRFVRPRPSLKPTVSLKEADPNTELEAGLLALESGSLESAVEWLRRATFRDPNSSVAHFALARAYLQTGDLARAHATLVHTEGLLSGLEGDGLVPGSDSLQIEALRQAVKTYLDGMAA
jgi:chemotaxis protein methyltransferase CheR